MANLANALPVAVALVLAARCLGWPFLWDDYDAVGRALSLSLHDLLPSQDVVFYRPVSREVYFWLVSRVAGLSPIGFHIASAVVAGTILILVTALVGGLAGARAGLVSGLVLACSAGFPLGIGWPSAIQDLLCLLFGLVALHLQLRRRYVAATLAMAAALLSKETALAFFPALLSIGIVERRPRSEIVRTTMLSLVLLGLWTWVHPLMRSHLGGAGAATGTEYVTLQGGSGLAFFRGLWITLNIPMDKVLWTGQNLLPAVVASLLMLFFLHRQAPPTNASTRAANATLLTVGTLLTVSAVGLTAATIAHWSPYYSCIPATGVAILAGTILKTRSRLHTGLILTGFLWLGLLVRDSVADPKIPSEVNFGETAAALNSVEHSLKGLHPTLPPRATVYVSVQTRGHGGLYRQLFRFQPLRVWYRDPETWILDPNRRRGGGGAEFLFWIDPNLAIYEIDLKTLRPRGPSESIDLVQYQKTLRGYAFGLAATGMVDHAVRILTTMPQSDQKIWAFDRRSAAMLLIASRREDDAAKVLAGVPSFDRETALDAVTAVLIEPVPGLDLDVAAMQAFGLDPSERGVLRELMLRLDASHSSGATRIARRLQVLAPGDPESAAILRKEDSGTEKELIAPIPHDVPQ